MPQSGGGGGTGGQKKNKKKGHAPAHQNRFAFRHNPKSKKTDKILSSPNVGVCRRCHEKIEWRKKYRKYKPRTQPGKCNVCMKRNVKAAYHTICRDCAVGDRANASVVANAAIGGGNGGSSGGTESDHVEADNNTSETADEKDEAKNDKPNNNRRVCEICVKDYAMTTNADEDADGDLDDMLASQTDRLKLRERRALQRKMERMQEEKRTKKNKKKGTAAESIEEEADENDGDSSDNHDDEIGGERHEETLDEHDDTKEESSPDEDNIEEHIDEEEDPFLKAVGGADKLLTGEAYQKALLERAAAPC